MRDDYAYDDDVEIDDAPAPARWKSALGAAVSVCVLAAVVTWSYRLGMRDAAEVPVIRAIEGVAKMRPEDPGGARFDHQGRAVYGAMAESEPTDPAETAELAPPPEPLAAEDLPPAELAKEAERAARRAAALAAAPAAPVVAAPLEAPVAVDAAAAEEAALAAAMSVNDEPLFGDGATASAPVGGAVDAADEIDRLVSLVLGATAPEAAAAPAAAGAVPPPRPRPQRMTAIRAPETVQAVPVAAVAAQPLPAPAAPAPVAQAPVGAQLQLGAYLSEADARAMWEGFRSRNGDLLAGRSVSIAPARVGEQTLYLLRAQRFADAREARRLCDALRARNEECFLVGAN